MWPWLLSSCLDGDFIFLLMIKVTPQFSKPQPSFIHSFILPLLRARPVPGFAPGTGGHRQELQTQEAGRESLRQSPGRSEGRLCRGPGEEVTGAPTGGRVGCPAPAEAPRAFRIERRPWPSGSMGTGAGCPRSVLRAIRGTVLHVGSQYLKEETSVLRKPQWSCIQSVFSRLNKAAAASATAWLSAPGGHTPHPPARPCE